MDWRTRNNDVKYSIESWNYQIIATLFLKWPNHLKTVIARYFICRWMVRQPCSIVQNLVVNYHLVVSWNRQSHIGTNVSLWHAIIIAIHINLLFVFTRAELWIIVASYSNIRHMSGKTKAVALLAIFCQNITYFYRKPFFRNAGKSGHSPKFRFDKF